MEKQVIDVRLGEKGEEEAKKGLVIEEFLEENKFTIGLLVIGVILIGTGILGLKIFDFTKNEPTVEILGEAETEGENWEVGSGSAVGGSEAKITVEAAGEVEKPGVYQLVIGSRVNDLLVLAGGMGANADREWVGKNINLAQKLQDGVKIFIPSKTQSQNLNLKSVGDRININDASEAELDTLWGVGPVTAKKIIEKRPYQKPEELLQKKIVKSNVWEEIKDKISVY